MDKERKVNIKKTLVVKQELDEDDLLDLVDLLEPRDLMSLYFIIVGMLSARGYEFIY